MRLEIDVLSHELLCHKGHMRSRIIHTGTGSLDASVKRASHEAEELLGDMALSCDLISFPTTHDLEENEPFL